MLKNGCCWNLLKACVQFSVLRLHCPDVNSKEKDVESCRYTSPQMNLQLKHFFAIVLSVNQLSIYGVAAICEEFEDHQDGSGEPDVLRVTQLFSMKLMQKFLCGTETL